MIEIAKALSINAKILIMDEPTSALTSKEIEDLFVIIRKLTSQGMGIVYISHRLEELQHIVDRITIMRDGKYITSMDFKDTSLQAIITNMVGREIKEKFPRVSCVRGRKILEVKHLNAGNMVKDINLELLRERLWGLRDLWAREGRKQPVRFFGVDSKESGEIILDGETIHINNPMDAIRAGIVLAPEDRKKRRSLYEVKHTGKCRSSQSGFLSNRFGVIKRKKEEKNHYGGG